MEKRGLFAESFRCKMRLDAYKQNGHIIQGTVECMRLAIFIWVVCYLVKFP